MKYKILIIDDEQSVCLSLSEILNEYGYDASFCMHANQVLPLLVKSNFNLILLDIRMPEMSGVELLRKIKQVSPEIAVIIISGYASIDDAVKAMRFGALNLYQKPLELSCLLEEIGLLREAMGNIRLIGDQALYESSNPGMQSLAGKISKVAPTDATVLITGESGTGKELVVKSLHLLSGRSDKPMLSVNCAAIPDTLLESYMFGHEKGAFTDAKELHKGLFEEAGEGTIFLDEIGDMSLKSQAKLLRVLQEGTFFRIGGTTELVSKARIIAATNCDLQQDIADKKFRADLFYRLGVVTLHIPPLQERREDIIPLAYYFIKEFNAKYQKNIKYFDKDVQSMLYAHCWPGNVRELKSLMERLCIFCISDTVHLCDLPEQYLSNSHTPVKNGLISKYDEMTKSIILEAINLSQGVKKDAAIMLGIDRKTLNSRLRKFGIES
ncbi:MAG: sigma-54-dependent Fis family transcriptional regulator [Sphaerochaeta sp.]|nr:sigma-54-dependent Fis family transcriptional regulator [Sphaerochaeta sp.]